jgi:hypothetical protein
MKDTIFLISTDNSVDPLWIIVGITLLIEAFSVITDVCSTVPCTLDENCINLLNDNLLDKKELLNDTTKDILEDSCKNIRPKLSNLDNLSSILNVIFNETNLIISEYNDIISEYISLLAGQTQIINSLIQDYLIFSNTEQNLEIGESSNIEENTQDNYVLPGTQAPRHNIPFHTERDTLFGMEVEFSIPTAAEVPGSTHPGMAEVPVRIPNPPTDGSTITRSIRGGEYLFEFTNNVMVTTIFNPYFYPNNIRGNYNLRIRPLEDLNEQIIIRNLPSRPGLDALNRAMARIRIRINSNTRSFRDTITHEGRTNALTRLRSFTQIFRILEQVRAHYNPNFRTRLQRQFFEHFDPENPRNF